MRDSFVQAIHNQEARTQNDMRARKSTANPNVDLFYKIGASRGKNIIPEFVAAYVNNQDFAIRIAQWARDVRSGAGERQLFKDILSFLENNYPEVAKRLIVKIPEIGRWDDMLIDYNNSDVENFAFNFYLKAIMEGNGLAAKWAPRKGKMAVKLRDAWGMTPKQYRKTLVNLTKVVESKMCNKEWDSIEFDKVPSLAHSRYRNAFKRNSTEYDAYVERLMKGTDKIQAGAVYPYDVLKQYISAWGCSKPSTTELNSIIAQWDALPNFMGEANVLPLVDVSGSMYTQVAGNLSALAVAVSLGLYCADKNTGVFNGAFLTFSGHPELIHLEGNIVEKMNQMTSGDWGMNTNLHRAFDQILKTAVQNKVSQEDMPEVLLILSDMQFDACVHFDDTAFEMISRKYEQHGYKMPKIVFWNLVAYDNVPVKFNEKGVALISGFSPTIMKSVLAGKEFTPEGIMLETIMDERYDW